MTYLIAVDLSPNTGNPVFAVSLQGRIYDGASTMLPESFEFAFSIDHGDFVVGDALYERIVAEAEPIWNNEVAKPQVMDAAVDDVYVSIGKGPLVGPVRP